MLIIGSGVHHTRNKPLEKPLEKLLEKPLILRALLVSSGSLPWAGLFSGKFLHIHPNQSWYCTESQIFPGAKEWTVSRESEDPMCLFVLVWFSYLSLSPHPLSWMSRPHPPSFLSSKQCYCSLWSWYSLLWHGMIRISGSPHHQLLSIMLDSKDSPSRKPLLTIVLKQHSLSLQLLSVSLL